MKTTNLNDQKPFQGTDIPISKILDCLGGNSGLTEEYIYSKIQEPQDKKYRILTASTDGESVQYIHRCKHPKVSNRHIAVAEGKPVIHVVRKGKAGFSAFFDVGNYTLNDDAYLLYLKEKLLYAVELKWLIYTLKPLFFEYSTSSDNGTWNKTAFLKNVKIDLPSIDAQKKVLKVYEKLEQLEKRLNNLKNRIESLFTKQISIA